MKYIKLTLLLFLFLSPLALIFYSCGVNDPVIDGSKSPRELSWSLDTVYYPESFQTGMISIWGSAPNDVYICGHNDGNYGQLWHYDGQKWKAIDEQVFETVSRSPVEYISVYGKASDFVFVVGARHHTHRNPPPNSRYEGLIIQYDGEKWIEHFAGTKNIIFNVYVENKNNVWACGDGGIVYHYDGVNWDVDTLKISMTGYDAFQLTDIITYKNEVYIKAIKARPLAADFVYYMFKKELESWAVIDSFKINPSNSTWKWGTLDFHVTSNGTFYSSGINGIFRYFNLQWQNIFYIDDAIDGIWSTNDNNILASSTRGEVYHYNGFDWLMLPDLAETNVQYSGVWMDKNEAFVIGYTTNGYPMKTVVWHGK